MKSLATNHRAPSLFESFFGDLDRAFTPAPAGQHSPAVEITRGEDAYKVRAVLPGVTKENLSVKVENGYLNITGKSSWSEKEENYKDVYSEIHRFEEFRRSLRLDEQSFDVERVAARLENGVLEVTLPIREAAKPKQIEVKID